jgi:uncharacterized DUF497 family protein
VEFDWDAAKHERNIRERGFGFDFAAQIFGSGEQVEREDTRRGYGEKRIIAIGEHPSGAVLTVVYADRGDVRWNHLGPVGEQKGAQAMVRKTLDEIMATPGSVDWDKLNATTEEDIRRQQIEDGHDPDAPLEGFETTVLPQAVRRKLGMTQEQ